MSTINSIITLLGVNTYSSVPLGEAASDVTGPTVTLNNSLSDCSEVESAVTAYWSSEYMYDSYIVCVLAIWLGIFTILVVVMRIQCLAIDTVEIHLLWWLAICEIIPFKISRY